MCALPQTATQSEHKATAAAHRFLQFEDQGEKENEKHSRGLGHCVPAENAEKWSISC